MQALMERNNRIFLYIFSAIGLLVCCSLPFMAVVGSRVLSALSKNVSPTPTQPMDATDQTPTASMDPVVGVCGGPPAMFILLVGSDARADSYSAGLADSMRIARVDFVNPGVMYLSFQRDLYVEIPGISEHGGITHGKLNQAYLYGNSAFGYYDGDGEGPGLLAVTMEHNFGTHVDHYVAVNMQTFVRVIDALGGLDINLPYVVDGRAPGSKDPSKYFPAGNQHLDGYRVLLLARMRHNGDLERSKRQNLILQALAAKLLSPAMLPAIPELISAFQGSVQTDLGPAEIAQLVCLATMLTPEKIVAVDFPEDLFTGTRIEDPVLGRTFVWSVDFNLLRAYVQYFNQGVWPASPLVSP
jgi:LCP family protein required for cell wall assembly